MTIEEEKLSLKRFVIKILENFIKLEQVKQIEIIENMKKEEI